MFDEEQVQPNPNVRTLDFGEEIKYTFHERGMQNEIKRYEFPNMEIEGIGIAKIVLFKIIPPHFAAGSLANPPYDLYVVGEDSQGRIEKSDKLASEDYYSLDLLIGVYPRKDKGIRSYSAQGTILFPKTKQRFNVPFAATGGSEHLLGEPHSSRSETVYLMQPHGFNAEADSNPHSILPLAVPSRKLYLLAGMKAEIDFTDVLQRGGEKKA